MSELDLDEAQGSFSLLEANWRHLSGFAHIGFALIAELRRLREEARWTPIEERLPEKGRRYLVFDGQTVRMADYQDGYDRFVATDGRSGFGVLDPSHWRPLPKPPEVG